MALLRYASTAAEMLAPGPCGFLHGQRAQLCISHMHCLVHREAMRSKLFHTLVLSSFTLGCSKTHTRPLSASDAGPANDVSAAGDVGFDARDPRYCEPGWPTTKGGPRSVCVDEEGRISTPELRPCAANYRCELSVIGEVGTPIDPSCCLLQPDAP